VIRWLRHRPPLVDEYLSLRVRVAMLTVERDALRLAVAAANERADEERSRRTRPYPYAWNHRHVVSVGTDRRSS
jgi:hypothetical protein